METPTPETPKSIRELVAERLVTSGSTVKDIVVGQLTQQEIDKRAATVHKALTIIDQNNQELRKVKPAPAGFDNEGKAVEGTLFTKEQAELRKKLLEQNAKVDAALTKALDQNDFSKLNEVTK